MAKTTLCQLFGLIFCHFLALHHVQSGGKSMYQLILTCMASGLQHSDY